MPRKSMREEKKPTQTASLPEIIEVCVDNEGTPVFLIQDEWTLAAKYSITLNGVEYIPPVRESMPWLLPSAEKVARHYGSDKDTLLFNDIERAIRDNSELPDERLYPFLAAWVMHTHIVEKFAYTPIITFYAVAARGKTRTCRTLLFMGRRGVHAESIREPDIIRKSQRFGCAFLFDIMDVWKKAERMGAEDILLSRFEKGITVSRVTRPEANGFDDTQHFTCFGPTLISTNEPAHRILDSRGVIITMRQASRQFETDLTELALLPLRERCTAFRARWLNKDLPEVKKPARDRLGDILRPIAQILTVIAPDRLGQFEALVKSFTNDRADSQSETPEGQIVRAVLDLENQVLGGHLGTREIVDYINKGKPERYHTTTISIGKRLAALGFNQVRIGDSRGIEYDKNLIEQLSIQFGHALDSSAQSGGSDKNQVPQDFFNATCGEAGGHGPSAVPSSPNSDQRSIWAVPPDVPHVQGVVSNSMPVSEDLEVVGVYDDI